MNKKVSNSFTSSICNYILNRKVLLNILFGENAELFEFVNILLKYNVE